jgi:hypothetical protein
MRSRKAPPLHRHLRSDARPSTAHAGHSARRQEEEKEDREEDARTLPRSPAKGQAAETSLLEPTPAITIDFKARIEGEIRTSSQSIGLDDTEAEWRIGASAWKAPRSSGSRSRSRAS